MPEIIAFFGFGSGVGSIIAVSAIMTFLVLLFPIAAGLFLYSLERLQVKLIGSFSLKWAYFFVNCVTFPGTFIHEMSHLSFAVITGADVYEICMFESRIGRLGHISFRNRGPWFMVAIQNATSAVAPTVVGLFLGYLLLKYTLSGGHSIWANIGLWYLIFCLVDHSTMSDADIKIYFSGVWIFILPIFLAFFIAGMM